jgi:prepilin-type N-terminal cleavage/methylation domain-containing protein
MFKLMNRKHKGFSLIEIMIVVVIIVLMAAAGMTVAGKSSTRAKFAVAEQDLSALAAAFQRAAAEAISNDGASNPMFTGAAAGDVTGGAAFPAAVTKYLSKPVADFTAPWPTAKYVVAKTASALAVYLDKGTSSLGTTTDPTGIIGADKIVLNDETNKGMYRVLYQE